MRSIRLLVSCGILMGALVLVTSATAKTAGKHHRRPVAHAAGSYCTGYANFKPPVLGSTLWFSNAICVQNDSSGDYRGYWNVAPRPSGGSATLAGCYFVSLSKHYSTGWKRVASSSTRCSPVDPYPGGLYIFTNWTARAPGTFCAKIWNEVAPNSWKQMHDSAGNLIQRCRSF